MPFRCLPVLLAVLLVPALASAREWQVDAAKSSLTFKGAYQNEAFNGKFGKFDAVIAFDEADPAQDRFDVKVAVASVATESSERDDTLKSDDFFDAAKYPQAHYVTESFAKGSDGALAAKGTLTIRNVSKPVTLKVKFAASGNGATLDVDTTLKRLDFGLGAGPDWADIGKDVPVHGHLVLTSK